jgi:hypothetical protein
MAYLYQTKSTIVRTPEELQHTEAFALAVSEQRPFTSLRDGFLPRPVRYNWDCLESANISRDKITAWERRFL